MSESGEVEVRTEPMATVHLPAGTPALRVTPMPADANFHGDIFGGWIMSQVDLAGSIPASRRARGRVATVAVNSFLFKQPVLIGDVVSFYRDDRKDRPHVDHRRGRGLRPAESGRGNHRQGHRSEPDVRCRRPGSPPARTAVARRVMRERCGWRGRHKAPAVAAADSEIVGDRSSGYPASPHRRSGAGRRAAGWTPSLGTASAGVVFLTPQWRRSAPRSHVRDNFARGVPV